MRTTTRIWKSIALLTLIGALVATAVPVGAGPRARDRVGMLELTNHSRQARGLRALELDRTMSELAQKHSARMARRGVLFHTSDPTTEYLRGRRWQIWGENVGVGGDLDELQSAFMASAPHRRNILKPKFRHVAIGVARVQGRVWVTVFFYG